MSDEDLVTRLRDKVWLDDAVKLDKCADAIERLTRERNDMMAVSDSYAEENQRLFDRAEAAERKVERLRAALEPIAAFNDEPSPRVYKLDGVRMVLVHYDVIRRVSDGARAALNETEERK